MFIFGKKKTEGQDEAKKKENKVEEHVICPQCFLDFSIERIQAAGGKCPSCEAVIDLEKASRAHL